MEYILMHRTKRQRELNLMSFQISLRFYEVYDSQHLPVGTVQKEVLTYPTVKTVGFLRFWQHHPAL